MDSLRVFFDGFRNEAVGAAPLASAQDDRCENIFSRFHVLMRRYRAPISSFASDELSPAVSSTYSSPFRASSANFTRRDTKADSLRLSEFRVRYVSIPVLENHNHRMSARGD